jgi:hypothetical protein
MTGGLSVLMDCAEPSWCYSTGECPEPIGPPPDSARPVGQLTGLEQFDTRVTQPVNRPDGPARTRYHRAEISPHAQKNL